MKTAVVTGASRGIGSEFVVRLLDRGWRVYAGYRQDMHRLDLLENENLFTCQLDVTDNDSIAAFANTIEHRVDLLINNAGVGLVGNIEETEEEDFDRLYKVNVKGVYNCIKTFLPNMKANGGVIINMASIVSHVAVNNRFAYTMTKGAVHAMTFAIAKDYIHQGIRCNSVSPARVHTPFVDDYLSKNYPGKEKEMFKNLSKTQPLGRMGKPEEIANLVLYLCSDEASFITGSDFSIDGGFVKLNGN